MAIDELLERPLQRRDIELSPDAHRAHQVAHGVGGGGLKQRPKRPLAVGDGVFMDAAPFKCGRHLRVIANPSADVGIERAFRLIERISHMARDGIDRGVVPHQGERQGRIEPILQSCEQFQGGDRIEAQAHKGLHGIDGIGIDPKAIGDLGDHPIGNILNRQIARRRVRRGVVRPFGEMRVLAVHVGLPWASSESEIRSANGTRTTGLRHPRFG